jgi:RHS repeat-associated protein
VLGRFTQVDPLAGYLTAPATQHPYAYALNNPGTLTDPTGRMPVGLLRAPNKTRHNVV